MDLLRALGGKTFEFEEGLPSLPLPSLENTLKKYLESTKPFLTDKEYEKTAAVVKDFGEGVGKQLHAKLEERAKAHKNWLEDYWENMAYLENRDPVAVLGGMYGVPPTMLEAWPPRKHTQLKRAAITMWLIGNYFQQARKQTAPIIRGRDAKPQSMYQFRSFMCSSRVPRRNRDEACRYFKPEIEGDCPSHVVVFCNGHVYKVEMFDENGDQYGSVELLSMLSHIKEKSAVRGQSIGALTADDRESWAKAREYLTAMSEINAQHLETIQSALCGVVLDSESPEQVGEVFWQSMCGPNIHDRWFDKGFNVHIFENGTLGGSADHTFCEGTAIAVLHVFMCEEIAKSHPNWLGTKTVRENRPIPEELVFVVDNEYEIYKTHAINTYTKNAATVDYLTCRFPCFGKEWCKKVRIHPDAMVQMAIQLAYYKTHGKIAPAYETGPTRQFYHGRTDTVRTCCQSMADWCKVMVNKDSPVKDKLELMKKVNEDYLRLTAEAVSGNGVDRHLLGLYAASRELEIAPHEIFLDPAFTKSGGGGNYVLSTTLVGYHPVFGSCAPMRNDGYGIFYAILPESVFFTITTFKTCPSTDSLDFYDSIHNAMVTIRTLISKASL